jgi:hypothetical protein
MQGAANQPSRWPWPDSLDAVVAAPGSHRVVLENQTTRVLEVTIAPGEREPQHTHRWPSVMVVHRPARIRYYTGETLTWILEQRIEPYFLPTAISKRSQRPPHQGTSTWGRSAERSTGE